MAADTDPNAETEEQPNEGIKSPLRASVHLASKLFGSSVLAQVAVLAATAYAAAKITPADFAWYGAVSGAVWIAASFNTLAVEHRIGVVDERLFFSLLRGAAVSVAMVSVLCLVGGAVGLGAGTAWAPMAFLVAPAALGLGIQQLLTAALLRELRQGILARGRLLQGVSNAVLIVLLVWTPMPGYIGLSLAWILSIFVGLVPLAIGAALDLRAMGRPARADLRTVIREVKLLPVSQLMAGSVASLPLIVLPALGDAALSGAWALVNRFLTPMVNTAYGTLQPLYYGTAAQLLRHGRMTALRRLHARWLIFLLLVSVPVLVLFVACIEWFIPLLGDEWHVASLVVVPACLFFTSSFLCLPLSHTLVLLGRVNVQFWWTAARCILCGLPFLFVGLMGPWASLLAWATAAAVTFFWQLMLHRLMSRGAEIPSVRLAL